MSSRSTVFREMKANTRTRQDEKRSDRQQSALMLASRSVGRFMKGPRDLSTSRTHLVRFGK